MLPALVPGAQEPGRSEPAAERPQPATKPRGPTDRAELEAFLDGVMAVHLKDKHIAGATISVVVDNKLLFAKGYGYADVAQKKPVNPEETMFRVGSVSKLLTWTAIMQLAEQGKVDLEADLNKYLTDFKIPQTFPKPITLKHLLTHTPGFEDHVIGLFARDTDKLEPLGKILARELPARVRPAGELASYSNHGTALAGYVVSQVAGVPWEDYIEHNILQPLQMSHTLVRQPPADKLPATMSKGYKYTRGQFEEQGFEYVPAAPAGSVSSSAVDMAHFLIAHLQDGQYESARILKEETARQMRELLFTHDPTLAGMAYGFMRMMYNGEEIVHHGGDTRFFHSYFVMLPQRKAGFFVSYNTETGAGMRERLFEAFVDRYYPEMDVQPPKPAADFHDRALRYAGSYGAIRRSYTSIAALGALFDVATIAADGDELLVSAGTFPRRFAEVKPLIFRETDGQTTLAFREDAQGRITHLFASNSPSTALVRLPWSETPLFNILLVAVSVAVCLSAVIGWPIVAFVRRGSGAAGTPPTRGSRWASWLAWITCVLIVLLVALSMIPLSDPEELGYGVPPLIAAIVWCTPLVAALVVGTLLCAALAWINRYWWLSGRLHYTCVAAAGVAFVLFLNHWNLLRFGP